MSVINNATINDVPLIIAIWEECNLTRPWNNPLDDIENALNSTTSTILLLKKDDIIIGTAMVGYDGHRGWVYYLAVKNEFQKQGYGKRLLVEAEAWLKTRGVPKVNLMIRNTNNITKLFYEKCGYKEDEVIVMGKFLTYPKI